MERPGGVDWFRMKSYDDVAAKRAAILSSRLACRRFREITYPILLPTVRVKLEQASLNRLDTISRIPDIAGGVRGIEIALAYRPKELAADLGKFITRRKVDVENARNFKLRHVYPRDPSIDASGNKSQSLGHESYCEYQRLHDEQTRLIDSGAFVDAIVSAVSRMPVFGSLLFDDTDIYAGHLTRQEREAPSMRLVLTAADRWSTLEANPDGVPPARILSDLPIAIHRAGVTLREICITAFPRTAHAASPVIRDAISLRAAFQGLEEVNFWPRDDRSYTAAGLKYLNVYLGALVSGHSLEHLIINATGARRGGSTEKSAIGPALKLLHGSHLKLMALQFAQFAQSEWDAFCNRLGDQLDGLSLSDVSITDGSWRSSIRVLRQKTASRCDEGLCDVSLCSLTGGEFGRGSSEVILNWWDPQRSREFML